MIAVSSDLSLEVSGIAPGRVDNVRFPRRQAGMTALVGFFEHDESSYVLKVSKTPELLHWALAEMGLSEPRLVGAIRRVSARWDSLAPRRMPWPTLERFNSICQDWLRSVSRDDALSGLEEMRLVARARAEELIDECLSDRLGFEFAPRSSETVRVSFVAAGADEHFALVQENAGSSSEPAPPFSHRIRPRAMSIDERKRSLEFLILLGRAAALGRTQGLGLDLGPRLVSGQLSFPNVLVRAGGGGLVYVDCFGLAQRDGNRVEASAFAALYGRHGLVRRLGRSVSDRLGSRLGDQS